MKSAKTVRLGDVCEVRAGDSAPQGEELYVGGTVPFVRTSDVGVIHFGALHQTRDRLTETAARKLRRFKPGSILFPKSGASTFLNHRVLLNVEACVASHLAVITPKDMLNERYLLYALSQVDARVLMQDSAYPALRASDIEAISLPLPPLSEQQAIVARLDAALARATRLAEHFTTIARNADLSFKATLAETFDNVSDKEVRLGDVCEVRAGADYKAVRDDNGAFPVYGTGGVMCRANAWRCPANSVIVGRKGTLDNPMLVKEPFWNIDTCFGLIPKDTILPEYLFFFCKNFDFYSLCQASGRPSTNSDAIKAISLPLSSLSEQKTIVARLDAARVRSEGIAEQARRGAAAAENLKKALLKEAFE